MKNVSIAIGIAVMVAACGGGGGDSTGSAPVAASSSTPVASTTTTTPLASSSTLPVASSTTTTPAPQIFKLPVAPTSGFTMSGGSFNEGGASNNEVITFKSAVDMTVSGTLNNIWVNASQPNGKVTVSGNMNTIVFMTGDSAQVTVTGSGNTFYVPTGAAITFSGASAASSTIRNYTP